MDTPDVGDPDPEIGSKNVSSRPTHKRRTLSMKGCETLKEMVQCSICLEKLKSPKMLPCQHTFCLMCLQNCLINDRPSRAVTKSTLSCPQCRIAVTLPANGPSSLPSNIYIQSLLDLIESDNLEKDVVRCHSCQTTCIDVTACQHCQIVFCVVCQDIHTDQLKDQVDRIAEQIDSTCDQLQNKARMFDVECSSVRVRIRTACQAKIQSLKKLEEELLETVQTEAEKEKDVAQIGLKKLTNTVDDIKTNFHKDFEKSNSSAEKVTLFLEMHERATKILSQVPKIGQTSITFDPENLSLTFDRKKGDATKAKEEPVLGSPTANRGRESPDYHSRYYRGKSFSLKYTIGIGYVQRPAGIAVCPWSKEVYAVSMDNHKVNIFDTSGKFLRSFGCRGQNPGEFLCPYGVAFNVGQRKIIITDKWKNCVDVFDADGNFVRQIGLKGRSPGHFRSPEGVATDMAGRIYVCDTGNDRVQVMDENGLFMYEVGVKNVVEGGTSRQKSVFNEPTGIAVTSDGRRIIVSDYGQHKIRVFDVNAPNRDGSTVAATPTELSLTLGTKGQLKGQFYNPECVAVDKQGFMLIGDSGNGRIQICRPDGKVIRTFGNNKADTKGQFSWISGIAVTDDYDILVSDFKNHCIKVF